MGKLRATCAETHTGSRPHQTAKCVKVLPKERGGGVSAQCAVSEPRPRKLTQGRESLTSTAPNASAAHRSPLAGTCPRTGGRSTRFGPGASVGARATRARESAGRRALDVSYDLSYAHLSPGQKAEAARARAAPASGVKGDDGTGWNRLETARPVPASPVSAVSSSASTCPSSHDLRLK